MPRRSREHRHSGDARLPSQRQLRVGEEFRHALAQFLRPGELHDPALRDANITVTEVRVSPDLRNATAFVMPLAGQNVSEIMEGLRRSSAFLKGRVGRELGLRFIPNLGFEIDYAFGHAERIAALLATPEVERDLHRSGDRNSEADSADGKDHVD